MGRIKMGNKNSGVTSAPGTHAITDVSSEIIAANPDRAWACITNVGSTTVFLAFGMAAIPTRGMHLVTDATYIIGSNNHTSESVNCITASGTSVVITLEATDE